MFERKKKTDIKLDEAVHSFWRNLLMIWFHFSLFFCVFFFQEVLKWDFVVFQQINTIWKDYWLSFIFLSTQSAKKPRHTEGAVLRWNGWNKISGFLKPLEKTSRQGWTKTGPLKPSILIYRLLFLISSCWVQNHQNQQLPVSKHRWIVMISASKYH